MTPPVGKAALDAMTDQSLAWTRDWRPGAPPVALRLGLQAAGLLAEQFPDDRETAGRVVMAVVQMIAGLEAQVPEGSRDARVLHELADVLALAAHQVIREAEVQP